MTGHTIVVTRLRDGDRRAFASTDTLDATKTAAQLLDGPGLRIAIITNRGTRWTLEYRVDGDAYWRHDTGRVERIAS